MALPLILAGLQVAGSAASAIQGNQNRQTAKGEIDKAYRLGRERLALRQGDQRRSQAESLIARGLSNGGGSIARAPSVLPKTTQIAVGKQAIRDAETARVTPPRINARTLGEAQSRDLVGEQYLEQSAMLQQRDAAKAGIDAGYTQSLINAGGNAIAGAINAYGAVPSGMDAKPDYGKGAFGVDPVSPWSKGYGPSVDSFNVIK